MNNDTTYYYRNKERLQKRVENCYHQKGEEKGKKNIKLRLTKVARKSNIKIERFM